MGPEGPGTKNDCAGEDLQQFAQNAKVWVVWQKNMVMSPEGPETKDDCAGKDQQQITRQADRQTGPAAVIFKTCKWSSNEQKCGHGSQ
jgi:hypothetical protein